MQIAGRIAGMSKSLHLLRCVRGPTEGNVTISSELFCFMPCRVRFTFMDSKVFVLLTFSDLTLLFSVLSGFSGVSTPRTLFSSQLLSNLTLVLSFLQLIFTKNEVF